MFRLASNGKTSKIYKPNFLCEIFSLYISLFLCLLILKFVIFNAQNFYLKLNLFSNGIWFQLSFSSFSICISTQTELIFVLWKYLYTVLTPKLMQCVIIIIICVMVSHWKIFNNWKTKKKENICMQKLQLYDFKLVCVWMDFANKFA